MKKVLDLDEELPAIEQYKGAATKLKSELPTNIKMERITLLKFSSLTEGIHVKHEKHHKILILMRKNF